MFFVGATLNPFFTSCIQSPVTMLFRAAWARQALPRQVLPRQVLPRQALPFRRQALARSVTTDAASAHAENVPQVDCSHRV